MLHQDPLGILPKALPAAVRAEAVSRLSVETLAQNMYQVVCVESSVVFFFVSALMWLLRQQLGASVLPKS